MGAGLSESLEGAPALGSCFRPGFSHFLAQDRSGPSGLGHFSGKTAYRVHESGPGAPTEALRAAQGRPQRPQQRPKTANIGPKTGPRPPTYAPRATHDRAKRPQERPKTAHRGPGAAQDRQLRLQEHLKTANLGPKSGPRPPTEATRTAQDHPHRHINFTIDRQSNM